MTDRDDRQYAPLGWCARCLTNPTKPNDLTDAKAQVPRPIAVALHAGTGLCLDCLRHEKTRGAYGTRGQSGT